MIQYAKSPVVLPVWMAITLILLQLILGPGLTIVQGHINFLLILVCLVAMTVQDAKAYAYAFILGLLSDLLSSGPFGLYALLYTALVFFMRTSDWDHRQDSIKEAALVGLVACGLSEGIYQFVGALYLGDIQLAPLIFLRFLPSYLATFILFVCVWFVLTLIYVPQQMRQSQRPSSHKKVLSKDIKR